VGQISPERLLEVMADFDEFGGASMGLVAWELYVPEQDVAVAWDRAFTNGWLQPAGHDSPNDEQLWRLTLTGRAASAKSGRRSS
jgi:hypothetical protein